LGFNFKKMDMRKIGVLIFIIGGLFLAVASFLPKKGTMESLTWCLKEKAVFYTASMCQECQDQLEDFGYYASRIKMIDCSANSPECRDLGVISLPAWRLKDGSVLRGRQNLDFLAQSAGCPKAVFVR
jgi:hypothetical protein